MNRRYLSALVVATLIVLSLSRGLCHAGMSVRVMVLDDLERISVRFPGTYDVADTTGFGVVSRSGAAGSRIDLGPETAIGPGIRVRAEDSVVSINEYALTGIIDVKRNPKGLFRIINELDLEEYTRAVIGDEMDPRWPIEALKAQAVAARTYALFRKSKAGGQDYDLCASVNSQMFTGDAWVKEGPAAAVEATRGLVLTYRGGLAEALYHGSCGGMTEDASEVWDKGCGYLGQAVCGCNSQSPYASWERTLSRSGLESAFEDAGYSVRGVQRVSVARRSGSGRAAAVNILHSGGTLKLSGNEFRRALGYRNLPSTFFSVTRTDGGFLFSGSGSGHGVGLCQWGAKVMAEKGETFEQILAHYYPELELARARGGREEGQ